jgi:hypothetical protein
MQDRHLNSDIKYVLHKLKSKKEIPLFYNSRSDNNTVILIYPAQNDETNYNACFIIENQLITHENQILKEVSMGNLSLDTMDTRCSELINMALVLAGFDVPESIKFQARWNDMNDELHKTGLMLARNTRCLAQALEAKEKKYSQDRDDDVAIAKIIADDIEQSDIQINTYRSNTRERKPESACTRKNNVNININDTTNVEEDIPLPSVLRVITGVYTAHETEEGYDFPNMPTNSKYAQLNFFGKHYSDILHTLGQMILRGCITDLETVLAYVKKNPSLMDTIITVEDPSGTPVIGTFLQIAAMAGDVNINSNITDEKDRGFVESLIIAGGLTKERVTHELACITSEITRLANDERNYRYLEIIKEFGVSIHQGVNEIFERKLQSEKSQAITCGFIFDPKILLDTILWFEKNLSHFGDYFSPKSDVFWINGFGKLQSMLSARDAQVIKAGIQNVIDENIMPVRSLKNPDGGSYYYNTSSDLGRNFYLGTTARHSFTGPGRGLWAQVGQPSTAIVLWETYIAQKTIAFYPEHSAEACIRALRSGQ